MKNQKKYCKFMLNNHFPLKIKATSPDGNKFNMYISFSEPFPDDSMQGGVPNKFILKYIILY